jgi:hypothetical protein
MDRPYREAGNDGFNSPSLLTNAYFGGHWRIMNKHMDSLPVSGRSLRLALVLLGLMVTCACSTVPPRRILPEHIKRIYIPEFRNHARIYGAQADLTLYVNDEFMSDGRLDVVQDKRSDVRLEGHIKSYRELTPGTSGDRFGLVKTCEMVCSVELWDPYDTDRIAPMYKYTVAAAVQYLSDPRRTLSETDTDARERLLRQMAKNIVQAVMTQKPEEPTELERKRIQKYQQRQGPEGREPVITAPRFPKPTPPGTPQN